MKGQTQTITVKTTTKEPSYEDLVEKGFDYHDEGQEDKEFYGKFATQLILNELTAKQRRIVICLQEGLTRKEIANRLMISTQEVHQIVLRIRKRIKARTQYGRSQMWTENKWR